MSAAGHPHRNPFGNQHPNPAWTLREERRPSLQEPSAPVSIPRQILPDSTYLLTRRCFQRQFLLRPDRRVNQIFRFCLAYAVRRFEIQLHAFCMLSNHYHLVVTDTRGNLPEFMHWLNEYVAKCVNAKLGRWESFWSPGSYSAVRLGDANDILAKMLYVHLNPVEAGLVSKAKDWPGERSLPSDMGAPPVSVVRPAGFFREMGPVPRRVELEIVLPDSLSEREVGWLEERIAAGERECAARRIERNNRFMGRRRILRQSPFSRPRPGEPRQKLNPRVAARDKWRRIELLQRLSLFVGAYRNARRRFLDGERNVEFPSGTYWMRLRCGVLCAGP